MFTLLLCVVGYLALTPTPPKQADLGWDKLNHFAAFATLAFSACMSFSVSKRNQALLALFLFAFGGAIELIQTRVPGRSCEWVDLFADTLGIGGGLLAATVILKIVRA